MDTLAEAPKTFIVGAGLTGLILGRRLSENKSDVVLIEKSKGVGGRMATRRVESDRFDHGAQFYTRQQPIEDCHQRWLSAGVAKHWFDQNGKSHFCSPLGMTALAKDLARGLQINFEKRLISIRPSTDGWVLRLESNEEIEAASVILTAPLPQSLEILDRSQIPYEPELERIRYAKAIVALIEVQTMRPASFEPAGYAEFNSGLIFSITDQRAKGISTKAAMTVVLNPESSEKLFETPDSIIADAVFSEIRGFDTGFSAASAQIKKWRYSHPLSTYEKPFYSVRSGLYLAGDAFGGPSLNGAARSADALAEFILRSKNSTDPQSQFWI